MSERKWVDLFGIAPDFPSTSEGDDLRVAAEWLVQIGYPFDFDFTPRPPERLWQAIIDVVHADTGGNLHGNQLTRAEVSSWLANP